jgi:hypothetical protein
MGASIEQDAHGAICAAHENDRPSGDTPGTEITRLGDLGGMSSVNPGVFKNTTLFEGQNIRVGERLAMHAKEAVFFIVDDQVKYLTIYSDTF